MPEYRKDRRSSVIEKTRGIIVENISVHESLAERLMRKAGLPITSSNDEPIAPDNSPLRRKKISGQDGVRRAKRIY